MSDVGKIRAAVYRTIDTVNDLLPSGHTLTASDDLVLIGHTAALDSMGFVNFIVALEEQLEGELQRGVNIPDLLAMQNGDGGTPLTVASLITLLSSRVA